MTKDKSKDFNRQFAAEVKQGLSSFPKYLNSKYFYDAEGDRIFQEIMTMPEYYLTRYETEVLTQNRRAIATNFAEHDRFHLIELGAGDGTKTKILLRELINQKAKFNYLPIDISQNILNSLSKDLNRELPSIDVKPQQGTYFNVLEKLSHYNEHKKVIVVLGSNIGNLRHDKAIDFLKNIRKTMQENDLLFMGFDQKKTPEKIRAAYNDAQGITARFNKNILKRINRKLDGNFILDDFQHWPTYNPETGRLDSYLLSKKPQQVQVKKLDLTINLAQWESIHTEISQKYTDNVVQWLATKAGLSIIKSFENQSGGYKNYLFQSEQS